MFISLDEEIIINLHWRILSHWLKLTRLFSLVLFFSYGCLVMYQTKPNPNPNHDLMFGNGCLFDGANSIAAENEWF